MSGLLIATAALAAVVAALGATLLRTRRRLDVERERAGNDALTGLPNRARLLADLERALPGAEVGPQASLLILDLDGFKAYNEAFGRTAGDELLARLSARLELAILPHGTAYRLGGDEFGALVRGSEERARSAEFVARWALSATARGIDIAPACARVDLREAADASTALALADRRLSADRQARRARRRPLRSVGG